MCIYQQKRDFLIGFSASCGASFVCAARGAKMIGLMRDEEDRFEY